MSAFGRFLPVKTYPCAGHVRCEWLVKSNANRCSNQCNYPDTAQGLTGCVIDGTETGPCVLLMAKPPGILSGIAESSPVMKYHEYPQVRYVNAKRCPRGAQHRRCGVFVTPKGEEAKPRTEAGFCGG